MKKHRNITFLFMLLLLLVSCAGSTTTEVRRPPGYAMVVGINDYEVSCGTSTVIVSHNAIDLFFDEDGTAKTRQEFCAQNRSDTRIRPPSR